jgi:antitoxin component YwqK of YwqJK toxin-antitoxin module
LQTKYYENGNKQSELTYVAGVMDGEAHFWFEDGKKDIDGYFVNDLQDGLWTYWRTDGTKGNEGNYIKGKMEARWTFWYSNGKIWKEVDYTKGLKDGTWNVFYENGVQFRLGQFENDYEVGEWKEWYADGTLAMQGIYNLGVMTGTWTTWHENGEKKSEIEYKDGLIAGKNFFWYPNGKKQLEESYKLVELKSTDDFSVKTKTTSVLHGTYKTYNIREFEIISGVYSEGKRNGKFVYNNNNGGAVKVEYYKMDKPDGKWQTFYDFGPLESEVNYENGLKEGKSTYYDQKGNITFQAMYHAGRQTDILMDSNPNLPQNQ